MTLTVRAAYHKAVKSLALFLHAVSQRCGARWWLLLARAVLCVVVVGCVGCGVPSGADCQRFALRLHLVDAPVPERFFVRLVVDATAFSSGTPDHLRATLEAIASAVAEREGTVIVYGLDAASGFREVGRYQTPIAPDASILSHDAYARRVAPLAFTALWRAGQSLFVTPPRRSRVLAALTNIAQVPTPPGHEVVLVLLSDLRDTDLIGDCHTLPNWQAFAPQLASKRFLEPGTLHGRVLIPYYSLSAPAEGCDSNERRAATLKELFTRALMRAGATNVEFSITTPTL
jgi:hypothetical protein